MIWSSERDLLNEETTRRQRELKEAWVSVLNRYPWHHFAHLTFRFEQTAEQALGRFRRYADRLNNSLGEGIWWSWITEEDRDVRVHGHALIGGTDRVPIILLRKLWTDGISDVKRYQPAEGAEQYLMDHLTPHSEWGLELSPRTERAVKRWEHRRKTMPLPEYGLIRTWIQADQERAVQALKVRRDRLSAKLRCD